jgi:tRNA nucleotidyltransferase (CCA-adding enzyme)
MLALGFRLVGKEFPVFLHPETQEEYALARTERKAGPGRQASTICADPGVTLAQDLARRDLTINALAEDADGGLIDYYGGREDLERRILRHVSESFREDPLRVLRLARFTARYAELDFHVAPETAELMREMVAGGELEALVPERVWQELVKALGEATPSRFFETLRGCGALGRIFPEIDRLWGVTQPANWHPEIDTGVHTMMVLDCAASLSSKPEVRFAALTHDLGKGLTPRAEWPRHRGHEQRGVRLVDALCDRLRAPNRFRELARLVARYHGNVHRAEELRPDTLLDRLEAIDAFRRPQRLEDFLLACEADFRGRAGFQDRSYPQAALFRDVHRSAAGVDLSDIAAGPGNTDGIRERVRGLRLQAIHAARRAWG